MVFNCDWMLFKSINKANLYKLKNFTFSKTAVFNQNPMEIPSEPIRKEKNCQNFIRSLGGESRFLVYCCKSDPPQKKRLGGGGALYYCRCNIISRIPWTRWTVTMFWMFPAVFTRFLLNVDSHQVTGMQHRPSFSILSRPTVTSADMKFGCFGCFGLFWRLPYRPHVQNISICHLSDNALLVCKWKLQHNKTTDWNEGAIHLPEFLSNCTCLIAPKRSNKCEAQKKSRTFSTYKRPVESCWVSRFHHLWWSFSPWYPHETGGFSRPWAPWAPWAPRKESDPSKSVAWAEFFCDSFEAVISVTEIFAGF